MVEKKTIGISALVVLLMGLSFLGGTQLGDDDLFYCESRSLVMQCEKTSKYYGLPTGKCWNSDVGNKLCRSGWIEVVDDTEEDNSAVVLPTPSKSKQYKCSTQGCVAIS